MMLQMVEYADTEASSNGEMIAGIDKQLRVLLAKVAKNEATPAEYSLIEQLSAQRENYLINSFGWRRTG